MSNFDDSSKDRYVHTSVWFTALSFIPRACSVANQTRNVGTDTTGSASMNYDTDTIDFCFFFSGFAHPACALEPVLEERRYVSDIIFRHVNDAFKERQKRNPERTNWFECTISRSTTGNHLTLSSKPMRAFPTSAILSGLV